MFNEEALASSARFLGNYFAGVVSSDCSRLSRDSHAEALQLEMGSAFRDAMSKHRTSTALRQSKIGKERRNQWRSQWRQGGGQAVTDANATTKTLCPRSVCADPMAAKRTNPARKLLVETRIE